MAQTDNERSLTRKQLVMAGGLLVLLVIVLFVAWQMFKPDYRTAFADLDPRDAATIVGELEAKEVPYKLEADGTAILVPASEVDRTRLAVLSGDLPLKGTVGLELFNESDLGLTDFAQRINYQRALQGELERSLLQISHVKSARVHLSLGDKTVFRNDRTPAKASILLTLDAGKALNSDDIGGIQQLVAAAVPDLAPQNVVVIDQSGEQLSPQAMATPQNFAEEAEAAKLSGRLRSALRERFSASDIGLKIDITFPEGLPSEPIASAEAPADNAAQSAIRDYPIAVSITVNRLANGMEAANVERELIAIAAQALTLNMDAGDSVAVQFGAGPNAAKMPIEGEGTEPAVKRTAPNAAYANVLPTWEIALAIGLAGVAALGAIWLFVRRRKKPKKPFSEVLNDLLSDEDARDK